METYIKVDDNILKQSPPASPKPKKRPCCVCKMSKKLRDNCIRNNDEIICIDFIKAHKLCLV